MTNTDYARHMATIVNALRTEMNNAAEAEAGARQLAASIRAGASVPLFAAGERGAVMAEWFAEEHYARGMRAGSALAAIDATEAGDE